MSLIRLTLSLSSMMSTQFEFDTTQVGLRNSNNAHFELGENDLSLAELISSWTYSILNLYHSNTARFEFGKIHLSFAEGGLHLPNQCAKTQLEFANSI